MSSDRSWLSVIEQASIEQASMTDNQVRAYNEVWRTRSNDPNIGAEVIIMQRQAEGDLSGYLLDSEGDEIVHLCLPALFESDRRSAAPALEQAMVTPYSQLADQQARSAALEQAMVTMSNQLADANRSLEGWLRHGADQERAIAALHEALDLQRSTIHHLRQTLLAHGVQTAALEQAIPPQADAPDASPNRSVVDQTIDALDKRLVGRTDRVRLRGALDKADAPLTGRAAGDEALGRIARLGALQGEGRR